MVNQNEKCIDIAKTLTGLALLFNADRSERQIAAMAGYLGRFFSLEEIKKASEFHLQRGKFFPMVSDFFTFCAPIQTLDQKAIAAFEKFHQEIREFPMYQDFINSASEESIDFVGKVGWASSMGVLDRKSSIETFKIIVNKPEKDLIRVEVKNALE